MNGEWRSCWRPASCSGFSSSPPPHAGASSRSGTRYRSSLRGRPSSLSRCRLCRRWSCGSFSSSFSLHARRSCFRTRKNRSSIRTSRRFRRSILSRHEPPELRSRLVGRVRSNICCHRFDLAPSCGLRQLDLGGVPVLGGLKNVGWQGEIQNTNVHNVTRRFEDPTFDPCISLSQESERYVARDTSKVQLQFGPFALSVDPDVAGSLRSNSVNFRSSVAGLRGSRVEVGPAIPQLGEPMLVRSGSIFLFNRVRQAVSLHVQSSRRLRLLMRWLRRRPPDWDRPRSHPPPASPCSSPGGSPKFVSIRCSSPVGRARRSPVSRWACLGRLRFGPRLAGLGRQGWRLSSCVGGRTVRGSSDSQLGRPNPSGRPPRACGGIDSNHPARRATTTAGCIGKYGAR